MTTEESSTVADFELEEWVAQGKIAGKQNSNLSWPFPLISGHSTCLKFLCLKVLPASPKEESYN